VSDSTEKAIAALLTASETDYWDRWTKMVGLQPMQQRIADASFPKTKLSKLRKKAHKNWILNIILQQYAATNLPSDLFGYASRQSYARWQCSYLRGFAELPPKFHLSLQRFKHGC
jgi:hypothetical protein